MDVKVMDERTDIIQIKGVGEKTARLFYKLDVKNVGELLRNYPRDYEMFSAPLSIGDAVSGELCAVRACQVGNMASKKGAESDRYELCHQRRNGTGLYDLF